MTETIISDILRDSVTRAEVEYTKPNKGFIKMLVGFSQGGMSLVMRNLPDLDTYWSHQRDFILASTVQESHWAQAVGIAIMKLTARNWDIDGNVPFIRKERARTIIKGFDYNGNLAKGFSDYITRDNGWYIEIVRTHTAAGSRVVGLNYLASSRCWPTGDPEIPVIYWDRLGQWYQLKAHQVIRLVDAPDGNAPLGPGMCAARRAYNDIREMAAFKRYRLEKATGARPLSIYFVTGVTNQQINEALMDAREKREAEGIVAYGGAAIVPFIQREGINMVEIPLSSLPDQFDYEKEDRATSAAYARALPLVTMIDLQAMPGNSRVGTASQSQIADDAAINKEAVLDDFTRKINDQEIWHPLPTGTFFHFSKNDLADRKREADIATARVNAAAVAVGQIGLNNEKAIQWLVDNDVFPDSWMPKATLDQGTLSDFENVSDSGGAMSDIVGPPPAPKLASAFGAGGGPRPVGKSTQGEDDVKAEAAIQMAMDAFFNGMAMGKQASAPPQVSGPNFHLDGVRMEMPEGLQQAMIKSMEKPEPPTINVQPAPIDLRPLAEALAQSNSSWATRIKQVIERNDTQELSQALYAMVEAMREQKPPQIVNQIQLPEERTVELDVQRSGDGLIQKVIKRVRRV